MAKLNALEELDAAIRSSALNADPKVTSRTLAEEFYRSQADLLATVQEEWVIEKLTALIGKHRLKIRRDNDLQLGFETALGLKMRPRKIILKSGEKMRREEATIGAWRQYRAILRKQGHSGLAEADEVIAHMEKYTKKEPHITWAEVSRRDAQKSKAASR